MLRQHILIEKTLKLTKNWKAKKKIELKIAV